MSIEVMSTIEQLRRGIKIKYEVDGRLLDEDEMLEELKRIKERDCR